MNKTKKQSSGNLAFKRETVRNLSTDEARQAAGGWHCQPRSDVGGDGTVCTMVSSGLGTGSGV